MKNQRPEVISISQKIEVFQDIIEIAGWTLLAVFTIVLISRIIERFRK